MSIDKLDLVILNKNDKLHILDKTNKIKNQLNAL